MRSRHPRSSRLLSTLAGAILAVVLLPQTALAQVSINPTESPSRDTGGWVYWMAEGAIVLGGIVLLLAGFAYLRFSPRFSREEEGQEGRPRAGVRVPEPQIGLQRTWRQASPPVAVQPVPPPTVAPPQPVAVGAPATPPAARAAPAAGAAASTAPAAPAGAPAASRPPRPKGEAIELDQETFERVLAEQLGKGTDRRVAEGRARSAAMKAAREKAGS
jgi:hypothetical protein